MPTNIGHSRLGIIVAKKIAHKAVDRNYMKRVLRELFRHECYRLGSVDLIVRPQQFFGQKDIARVREEFMVALARLPFNALQTGR